MCYNKDFSWKILVEDCVYVKRVEIKVESNKKYQVDNKIIYNNNNNK